MIIFSPNCTLPGHDRGLVASPSVRSTADIVWSCVATLLLCCWSILHLKVPPQFQPTNRSQRNFRAAWLVWRKVKWMCVSILAPEAVLAKAVTDFLAARANTKLIGAFAEEDKVQWTESHSFLADMGGFTIRFCQNLPASTPSYAAGTINVSGAANAGKDHQGCVELRDVEAQGSSHMPRSQMNENRTIGDSQDSTPARNLIKAAGIFQSTTRTVSSVLASAVFGLEDDMPPPGRLFSKCGKIGTNFDEANTKAVSEYHKSDPTARAKALHVLKFDTWTLTARQLYEARKAELICELPNVTKDDILDRSKGDWLVKVLASLQIAWLGLQVVWRWYLDIATTPLEVMTFAFAATAVITYLFLMRHPKDVMTTIYLRATKAASPEDVRAIYASGPRHFGMMKGIDEHAVPNNAINTAACEWFDHEGAETAYIACLYIGSAIFCGLHLLAWNFPFPTAVDQVIWRVATLVSIMAPVGIPFLVCIPYRAGWSCCRKTGDEGAQKRVEGLLVSSATFGVLVVARLLLIVEVFRTLYFLPQDAYLSTWTSNMPHMG